VILAEGTFQIAAPAPDRQDFRAWTETGKRFFLYWIDRERGDHPVIDRTDDAFFACAYAAEA
jgi:hypothetical protein